MHYCRFCSPQVQGSVTSRGRGRGRQCPGGGSRDPAAACPQRGPQGLLCAVGWGCGRSRAATGRWNPLSPAPECQSWHHRTSAVTSRECSPRRLFGPCPQVIRLALGWGWWKNLRKRHDCCWDGAEPRLLPGTPGRLEPGSPHHSAIAPRGRQTLRTAATASPRIC